MPLVEIKVTATLLKAIANKVGAKKGGSANIVLECKINVDAIIAGTGIGAGIRGWKDPMSDEFRDRMRQLSDDLEKLRRVLEDYEEELRAAATRFGQAVQNTKGRIRDRLTRPTRR